ncbi:MAG: hypothetical protein AAFS12_07475, partial [Cyanobacteria bacterium J06632_19]
MNKKTKKFVVIICYLLITFITTIVISANTGIAKQLQINTPIQEYQTNLVTSVNKIKYFGRKGRSGRNGRNGDYGIRGKNISIVADGTTGEYNVSGSN